MRKTLNITKVPSYQGLSISDKTLENMQTVFKLIMLVYKIVLDHIGDGSQKTSKMVMLWIAISVS